MLELDEGKAQFLFSKTLKSNEKDKKDSQEMSRVYLRVYIECYLEGTSSQA